MSHEQFLVRKVDGGLANGKWGKFGEAKWSNSNLGAKIEQL
jgi:hypothetical protein